MSKYNLRKYGWDAFFAKLKKASNNKDLEHGRVISVHRSKYEVVTNNGIIFCDILGNLQFKKNPLLKPAVGDWVILEKKNGTNIIIDVLERRTLIKRQKKHDPFPKPIASNIDRAFIIQSIGNDFNIKRLNRILIHVHEVGIIPVIVINKIDLVVGNELENIKKELSSINSDIRIIYISNKTGEGFLDLKKELIQGETIIFIGSSGVGKSSIINSLLDKELQFTQAIIKTTGKGKHTTTVRKLIMLEDGVMVIDTPGTREFGMRHDSYIDIKNSFDEIEQISSNCNFFNCGHTNEIGCAVREALKNGDIDYEVYKQYINLKIESRQTAKQIRQFGKQSSKNRLGKYVLRSVRRGKVRRKK